MKPVPPPALLDIPDATRRHWLRVMEAAHARLVRLVDDELGGLAVHGVLLAHERGGERGAYSRQQAMGSLSPSAI